MKWSAAYNFPGNSVSIGKAIAVDASGNVFVSGDSHTSTQTGYDYIIMKYDANGQELWSRIYNGNESGHDFLTAMVIDDASNVYVTGMNASISADIYATVKYDSNGNLLWVATYDFPDNYADRPSDIVVDNSGNVYVTGSSLPVGVTNSEDYATVKYNSDGIEQWVARYNGPGDEVDLAKSIALDNSNNIYVTGRSAGINSNPDYVTIKYNSNGAEQWLVRYDGSVNLHDEALAVSLDSQGNVYVVGQSMDSDMNFAIRTIKYSQSPSDIQEINSETPDGYSVQQNYPNPFNPSTTISWQSPTSSHQTLKIYDVLGNEVATLVDEYKSAGTYKVEFDATDLTSGVYIYQLIVGNYMQSRKMVVLK